MLHGFMSSNLQWAPNRERLAREFDLVLVELFGHGRSPAPEDVARYTVAGYVSELERIREEVGAERWFVCGQSFGAGIAIRYALAHAPRTLGLIVTNSRSALNDVGGEGSERTTLADWERIDARTLPYHPCHARRFPDDLKARMEAAADAIPPRALWYATSTTARDLSCRDRIAELTVPSLLVNGRFEKRFQPDRDLAARTLPGLEVVDLDGGHSVNIEAAEAFDAALVRFARASGSADAA